MPRMKHVSAVNRFIKASPWLSDEHLPAVTALLAMAETLDKDGVSPSLMGAYGQTFRSLQRQSPAAEPEEDELEGLLKR